MWGKQSARHGFVWPPGKNKKLIDLKRVQEDFRGGILRGERRILLGDQKLPELSADRDLASKWRRRGQNLWLRYNQASVFSSRSDGFITKLLVGPPRAKLLQRVSVNRYFKKVDFLNSVNAVEGWRHETKAWRESLKGPSTNGRVYKISFKGYKNIPYRIGLLNMPNAQSGERELSALCQIKSSNSKKDKIVLTRIRATWLSPF